MNALASVHFTVFMSDRASGVNAELIGSALGSSLNAGGEHGGGGVEGGSTWDKSIVMPHGLIFIALGLIGVVLCPGERVREGDVASQNGGGFTPV